MKILDCTLRDGGYYTNWDFDRNLVDNYISSCNNLPIDYLEVGYRSIPMNSYFGEYFYLPTYVIERLKGITNKKLVIILNEKDVKPENLHALLSPCIGLIDMVRLAIDPKHFNRALKLAESIKIMGFEVGFNVMYMSKWKDDNDFLQLLKEVEDIADYFYMVDSYGGVYPKDVIETIEMVRSQATNVPLGFHGHNNLELALINTLTALEHGCEIVDATITGMGRGAGNVKTELLLTALNSQGFLNLDFNALSKVVDGFTHLQNKYEWGTNLPYMVSGAHSLPQKDVMDWVGKRYYSYNSIIRALQNQAKGVADNEKFPVLKPAKYKRALLVGGGESVFNHSEAVQKFLNQNSDILVVHASSKNASSIYQMDNDQVFCLVGNEGYRMEDVFKDKLPENVICVLPSFPRKMGTYVPKSLLSKTYELGQNKLVTPYNDSHTGIAINVLLELNIEEIFVIGYDGYHTDMSLKEQDLFSENSVLFEKLREFEGLKIVSLTDTKYNLDCTSIFSFLY